MIYCNKKRALLCFLTALVVLGPFAVAAPARVHIENSRGRFFFSGNGRINLLDQKTGKSFSGTYRTGLRDYDASALAAIYVVFGTQCEYPCEKMSLLRLIEFIDMLEDRIRPGARITITSGYRSPAYNKTIRNQGNLAAKASLHQYGMAADLKMEGVSARVIWEYVKTLGYGGAGYYHGDTVHIDVGPARFWDEKTSGVGTGISDHNKLIGLTTDWDVYLPGESLILRFIRMTACPISVNPRFTLERMDENGTRSESKVDFTPRPQIPADGPCLRFTEMGQMSFLQWRLPTDLSPGRYRVRTRFCNHKWKDMPAEIFTPEFEVVRY